MKPRNELNRLLDDVLSMEPAPGIERETSLELGLRALHRRDRRRRLVRPAAVAGLAVLLLVVVLLANRPASEVGDGPVKAASTIPVRVPNVVPGTEIEIISDEELFALFPDRPLALVGLGETRELVFLDEVE